MPVISRKHPSDVAGRVLRYQDVSCRSTDADLSLSLCLGHFGALAIAVSSVVAELFLDAEKLVVLGHTVGTACGTGLDLAGVGSHCDVGDSSVFGFARTGEIMAV